MKWQESTRFVKSPTLFCFFTETSRRTSRKFLLTFLLSFTWVDSSLPSPCFHSVCSCIATMQPNYVLISALCCRAPTPPFRQEPDKRTTVSNEKNCRCTFPSAALPYSLPFFSRTHTHAHTHTVLKGMRVRTHKPLVR